MQCKESRVTRKKKQKKNIYQNEECASDEFARKELKVTHVRGCSVHRNKKNLIHSTKLN